MLTFTVLIACKSVSGYYLQIYSKRNTVVTEYKYYTVGRYYLHSTSAIFVLNLKCLNCVVYTNVLSHICSLYRYV